MNAATSLTLGNWTGHLGMGLALRELQCVLGIAMGQTSKELARDLGIGEESVKKRVFAASTKMGVTRRAQLVAEAMRKGVISPLAATLALVLAIHGMVGDDEMLKVRRGSGERRVETRVAVSRIEASRAA